jgi:mannose-6-phosphate isomerase-like protein (cupin superfamily)
MPIIEGAGRFAAAGGQAHWVEHLRSADLSVGTYSVPAGAVDEQTPHTEDEIYVVTRGRATLRTPDASAEMGPGDVAFVPAGEEHRFVDIAEDFAVLVVFGPAEYSRAGDGGDREG